MTDPLFTQPHILSRFYAYKDKKNKPSFWSPRSGLKSFEAITEDVERVRSFIAKLRINRSEPCLLLFHFSYEFLVLLFALLADGLLPVLIDPRLTPRKWRSLARTTKVKYIFFSDETKLARVFFFPSFGQTFINVDSIFSMPPANKALVKVSVDDPILISFTSGTTGEPKAIYRSLKVLGSQQSLFCKYLSNVTQETHLALHGIGVIQSMIQGSPTFYFPTQKLSVAELYKTIESYSVSTVSLTPGVLNSLVCYLEENSLINGHLKFLVTGGAPIPKWLVNKSLVRFPSSLFINVYASTECEPISLIGFSNSHIACGNFKVLDIKNYPESFGYPVGNVIEELEFDVNPIPSQSKAFFELTVRGQNTVPNGPNGFDTGDILYQENGLFFYSGRTKEQVENVPAGIVEDCLERLPKIKRAAIKSARFGIKVYLETQENYSLDNPELHAIVEKIKMFFPEGKRIKIKQMQNIPVDRRHQWKIQRKKI